ncbi:hypothetical protein CLV63_1309 [Murinocardiopsis flavida]|uniref:Uncharacterized protein n=1 Tax=Murinocardiopsis flavida TaxID=645275 RepID=A0A2P8CSX2_9ACTN|nr:hypothetical protein [Murinocardiopsis flavida]PSK88047.1 hypothetical protein CLV63_1309 [Murinocardiopsis flavida]
MSEHVTQRTLTDTRRIHAEEPPVPPQRPPSGRAPRDREQDAELASLIRRLATIRPDVLLTPSGAAQSAAERTAAAAPVALATAVGSAAMATTDAGAATVPTPVPAPQTLPIGGGHEQAAGGAGVGAGPRHADVPLHLLTREDFPVDRDSVVLVAKLRAMSNGAHKAGDYWPVHAGPDFLDRKRRPPLRRRVARAAAHCARQACMATGAITLTALPVLGVALLAAAQLPH